MSPSTVVYGRSVNFAATVTANRPGSGKPTCTVTYYDKAPGVRLPLTCGDLPSAGHRLNLCQSRGNYSSNADGCRSDGPSARSRRCAAVPRSPRVSAAARRTSGCRSASAWARAGSACAASAPKRRKVSTAANRTMASGSAVAIVARLGRTLRSCPIADVQGKQRC